ncbi:eIF2A-related protein [Fortiea contorta]|uniref:nSTAND1 domain-containing NTPase n=1 Tax=Fortiea contorta TaxID=1892405 RepID=UPI00034AA750|nr:caspase family protein [Fortiea contorta]
MCPRGVTTSRSTHSQQTTTAKLWLLLVGVNQYQDHQLPALRYSAVDCQVLAEALTTATQAQFPQKEVKIYHDLAPRSPLLATIRESLAEIAAVAQPIDTVLFYFSGHGMLESRTQEAFLCLADTQKDNLEATGLAVKELLSQLSKSGAQNQVVWLDACHSGGMTLRGTIAAPFLNPTSQLVEVLQRSAAKGKGFYALLSCDVNQQSWEFPELGHGVFTYYLMRGLQGGAADAQGVIFADGLYRYVYHQTLQYIDKTNQQLRLINQQKRGKGDTQLFGEYPLQTPKRIVEGVGELVLGSIPVVTESYPPRTALVIDGLSGSQATLDFSQELVDAGMFELEYLPRPGQTTAADVRGAIQKYLHSGIKQKPGGEKPGTVLLYLRGRLEETPSGETALLIAEDIWLSRSWIRQQLRRSQVAQQIIILDFPVISTAISALKDWVEELQLDSETAQCIIAATSSKNDSELFAATLINTLKSAAKSAGLSVAGWITQLQVQFAAQTPLHFWLSGTQGVIEIIPATTGTRNSYKAAALDLKICPYRGLRAFGEEDAQYFYGRESLTQHLISQLAHNSFLAVVGASGSGKSSVVQAGLIAQLRQGQQLPHSETWLIKSLRPGSRPLEALARRLGGMKEQGEQSESVNDYSFSSSPSPHLVLEGMLYQGVEGFVYWLRSRPEPMVVLVVDQFEELFTLTPDEDRLRFLEIVLGAVEYAPDRFKLVMTLRADFIAACLEVPALASLLQRSSVLVPPSLTDGDYRRVIVNPAEQVKLQVEPELVEVLVQELNHSAGDLPLLEFVLEQLWEFRQAGKLTLAAYQQQVGGIKGALERKAQAVYESLDNQAKECARWIFLSLTQLGEGTEDTRRRVFKSELVVKKYPDELIERTLQALTSAKLVVVNLEEEIGNSKGSNSISPAAASASPVTIEVAHEILIRHWSTLRWWLEENRSRLRSQRQIEQSAALWKHNQELADFLLQGVRLAEAEEIYVKYTDELSTDVQNFIAACLTARQQQQFAQKKRLRQAQRAVVIISVLGIAACGLGGVAYLQKQAAQLREIAALNASSQALLLSHQQLEALIAGVKAGREIKRVFAPNRDMQLATVATLQQALSQTQEVNRLQNNSQQVNAVVFSDDGKLIAAASDDQTIKIWNLQGKLINTITNKQGRFTAVAFSPDSQLIAAASTDKTIKIYGIDGKLISTFAGHTDITTDVAFSYDGKIVASASRDKTIKLWSLNGSLIKTWNAHNGWVNTIKFSPDNQTIASGGEDNLVKLWRTADAKLIRTLTGHQERVTCVKFSPDGKMIAAASDDKTIKIWNSPGKLLQTLEGNNNQINSISFSPNQQLLAVADVDGIVKIWQNKNQVKTEFVVQQTLLSHGAQVTDVNFSPDGKILASASADKTVRLWEFPKTSQPEYAGSFYSVSFSQKRQLFAAAGWDGKIKIWANNGIVKLIPHHRIIFALDFSPNGKIIAAASDDKTIKLWDTQNGKIIQTLTGHTERVTSVSFSPNGKTLASGSADKTIKLWRVADGKLLKTIKTGTEEITSVSFSPDNQMLASGSYDKTVKLWKLDGSLVKNLPGHGLAIASVKFSPDGTIIASASMDNTIKLWQIADGTLINTLAGHNNGVTSLSFLPHTSILASGSADNTIKLWNISDGSLIKTLAGHPGKVNSISFSPDGKILVSGSEDSGLTLWDLNLDNLRLQGCSRIKDYLKNNANVNQSDRQICQQ